MNLRDWPPGRPRVLVADAWLANAGDGAIAIATQRQLARLAPGAAVVHAAYQGDLLATHYPELALVPPLAGLAGVTPTIPEMLGWSREDGERLLGGADVVLSQGGGFAMEHYRPLERLLAWEQVVERGIPIGFAPQSVSTFGGARERDVLRRVYRAAVVVAVRDPRSAEHVLALGAPSDRVAVAADAAWGLFPLGTRPPATGRRGFACVLSRHAQLRADGRLVVPGLGDLEALLSALVDAAGDEHVTLLSTQQGLGRLGRGLEDDGALAAGVRARLGAAAGARVQLTEGYLPPQRVAELIAAHRGVLSMRMHPALMGVAQGVPTALVSEAFKATAMFELVGLGTVVQPTPVGAVARVLSGAHADLQAVPPHLAAADRAVGRLLAAAAQPVAD